MATGKGRNITASRPSNAPTFNAKDIRNALARYDRAPFVELLAKMIELFPDEKSLQALAMKKPEAFISSMIAMARISGFTEKQEVFHEHSINIHKMSDSQLEDHAAALAAELGFKTIEGTVASDDAISHAPRVQGTPVGEESLHAPRGGKTID